jgi:ABC-type cobalamin/Fe3+-siderophores transport system ATPase subunit
MTNLFTNYAIIKSVMKEARRIKPVTERAAIKIQKEINYAAEHGRGDIIVHTGDFLLSTEARKVITQELQKAGYKHRWRNCNSDDEIVHVWWWEDE